ncbi:hypothetical protein ACO0LC_27280 [Undibacterium sp. JH2W]|uniref:hypothetical protein n=1 Tax=Undibacterium sp. JH2W TaxID=3413037 RepID=UPI003BF430C2
MGSSNETTLGQIKTLRFLNALIVAGKYAAIFLPLFFFYLLTSIFMAGGNGAMAALANISLKMIEVCEKLLNMHSGGTVFQACFFWMIVFYAILFLQNLFFSRLESLDEKAAAKKYHQMKFPAFLSLLFLFISLTILIRWI